VLALEKPGKGRVHGAHATAREWRRMRP
jgi:hypothetical protein